MFKFKNLKIFLIVVAGCALFSGAVIAQVKLETALPPIAGQSPEAGIPQYINYLFIFGLGAIGVLAFGQIMIGGLQYILAAGNVSKVEDAKDTIQQALIGMGLLLVSYLLLNTINPDLVNLNPNIIPEPLQFNLTEMNTQGIDEWLTQKGGATHGEEWLKEQGVGGLEGKDELKALSAAPDGTQVIKDNGDRLIKKGNTIYIITKQGVYRVPTR